MAHAKDNGPRPAEEQDVQKSNRPEAVFRFGSVSAAVFQDHVVDATGSVFPVARVSLRRYYRSDQGGWKHTQSLDVDDLLPAALALTRAYESLGKGEPPICC